METNPIPLRRAPSPPTRPRRVVGNITPQGRGLSETIRGDRRVYNTIFLLHSSPCYVSSDPGSHIFIDLDRYDEDETVDHDHTEQDTEVHPFRSVQIDLKHHS